MINAAKLEERQKLALNAIKDFATKPKNDPNYKLQALKEFFPKKKGC